MLNFDVCISSNSGIAVFHAPEMPNLKKWELAKLPYTPGQTIFVRVNNVSPKQFSKSGNHVLVENLDGIGFWETSVNTLENIKPGQFKEAKAQEKLMINNARRRKVKKNKLVRVYRERDDSSNDDFGY